MRKLRVIAVLFTVLVVWGTSAVAEEINPMTGQPAVEIGETPIPERPDVTEVLWDTTHGVCFDYEPSGAFADLVALLTDYNFTTSAAGIDNIDLSPYKILIFCIGSACDGAYTASEVGAAVAFANSGGSILVLGDNSSAWPQNVNPISQAFGTTIGINTLDPIDLYFSNFAAIDLFTGIDELYFRAGGALDASAPTEAVAWTNDSVHATISASDDPCVIVTGDLNMFAETEYFTQADNQAFAINVFNWLRDCGAPTPVEAVTWGTVKSVYR